MKNQSLKKIFFTTTTLFVLLTSSVSWGGVNGKGVICDRNDERLKYPFFLLFKDGYVHHNGITDKDDKIVTTKGRIFSYETTSDEIVWFFETVIEGPPMIYSLNRKNLILTVNYKDIKLPHICRVFSEEELIEEVNKLIGVLQSKLDSSLKENKI
jgi:hypothetical protein